MTGTNGAEWNAGINQTPNPHPLQSWEWGQFKSRWGWQPYYKNFANGQATALILQRKTPYLPFSILYVPKGPGADYSNPTIRAQLLADLAQYARSRRAIFIKIDPDLPLSTGLEPETPHPVGQQFVAELQSAGWQLSADQVQFRNSSMLDLSKDESALLGAMKQKTRYNIRLAGRRDVTVRSATPADFPTLLAIYLETAERDGFTPRPSDYYLDAWQSFYSAGIGHALFAQYHPPNASPITLSAIYLLKQGNRVIYWQGASTQQERQRMPNYLLQWEAIRWAKAQGCTIYDFWGVPDQFDESDRLWGVWRFKKGFNGTVTKHIGAWDYPARPFWYWVYSTVMPRYFAWLKRDE